MKKYLIFTSVLAFAILNTNSVTAQIKRIWLTHKTNEPSHIVVNWESSEPGNSEVYFGAGSTYEHHQKIDEKVTLHHVEIPLQKKDVVYHYKVQTNQETSADHTFKAYPTDELKVVIVGNWGYSENPDLSNIIADDPHLLITCGDNVPNLHELCGEGAKECVQPYLKLVDSAPEIFSSIPFMPILGNHDKQIRDRGIRYPKEKVYDVDATAYRKFVELPGDEWKWVFSIPDFDVSFVALDLNHLSDLGTTYQSSHDYRINAEQFQWYQKVMNDLKGYVITLLNEKNSLMRTIEHGAWNRSMQKGTAVMAGFGYYSERAEADNFPYFNTSLKLGDLYPDPLSKFFRGTSGYILLTFAKNKPMVVELKSLDGKVIDRSEWQKKK